MSKITISAILALVRLILGALSKIINLIDVVRDLIDDGSVNGSIKSKWSTAFDQINEHVLDLIDTLRYFESGLPESITEDTEVYGLESDNSKE